MPMKRTLASVLSLLLALGACIYLTSHSNQSQEVFLQEPDAPSTDGMPETEQSDSEGAVPESDEPDEDIPLQPEEEADPYAIYDVQEWSRRVADDSLAAQYLVETSVEEMQTYFYLLYQTQTGITAGDHPTGFDDPTEISSEGLLRFFCTLNSYQTEAIADMEREMYYLPDVIVFRQLDVFFQDYNYNGWALPAEFGYSDDFAALPFAYFQEEPNNVLIRDVYIRDPNKVKIVALGLDDGDGTTPINRQSITLLLEEEGFYFESYAIEPLPSQP